MIQKKSFIFHPISERWNTRTKTLYRHTVNTFQFWIIPWDSFRKVYNVHTTSYNISFSISQTISFVPEPRHNEASLFCEYRQLDGNGEIIFNDNAKHVLLKVKYVLDPNPLASSKTYSVKVSIYNRNSSSTTIFR